MCGIVGKIDKYASDPNALLKEILHRGPDSDGYFSEENLILGHTRLSIQDLSENGNQPMFSADGKYVIIFNGEVYNHQDIRKELENEFQFKSTGDTETVLYAYIKYGADCLVRLNGIFAFAIYNRESKEILIARDHFGVKPLYIYSDKNKFLFGSEIKAFLSSDIDKAIDHEALVNYLTFLWSPGDKTAFKYVKKLLPGHYLKFNVSNHSEAVPVQFYKPTFNGKYFNKTEDELIDELDRLLIQAVGRQMLSDVPVGFFLSGGLDSTLVVAIARKLFPDKKFPCFTIDIDSWSNGVEDFASDIYYARKAAEFLDVELHIVKANIDIVKDFNKMIWHLDEPQADAAPLNVLNIAALARDKGIKVLLGGTAGDDLFSGYRRHKALRYEAIFEKIPRFLRRFLKSAINLIPSQKSLIRRLKKLTIDLDKEKNDRIKGYFKWLPVEKVKLLFNKKLRVEISNYDPTNYFDEIMNEIPQERSMLNKMLFLELKTFLVDHNLNYTDKMAMAVGVETRVPFLDTELVEFSQHLPLDLKMRNGETKYILKKVAERYIPKNIIYRPKTGFGAPVRKWITEDLDEMIHDYLSKEQIENRGIFDADEVWKLIEDNKSGRIDGAYPIWSLLAIESWLRQFSAIKK